MCEGRRGRGGGGRESRRKGELVVVERIWEGEWKKMKEEDERNG